LRSLFCGFGEEERAPLALRGRFCGLGGEERAPLALRGRFGGFREEEGAPLALRAFFEPTGFCKEVPAVWVWEESSTILVDSFFESSKSAFSEVDRRLIDL
jgi:hypothetical protein